MIREFDVILEPEASGGYSVYVPSLPGCFSQGETVEDALAGITEAIQLYLETLAEQGNPLPPAALHERVSVAA